ncbi:odorant receptor 82a-like [Cylas formicarius]|uniref:odorant receptor 82a-like n=1 Tax=Cylas formicarius TaxID=197179 RepID=UPI002958811F|nr:odorant receptor 82a-like [Cylas formicarius]
MTAEREIFKIVKWLMIASGTWRLDIDTISKTLYKVYLGYSYSVQFFYYSLIVSLGVEFTKLFGKNTDAAIENVSKMCFALLLVVKITLCQSENILKLMRFAVKEEYDIFNGRDEATKNIYLDHITYCTRITSATAIYSFGLGIYLSEIGIEKSFRFNKSHDMVNSTLDKPLPMPTWYPFDKNKHHAWALGYQVVEILLTALYSGSVHAFTNSVMIFIRAQLQILQYHFKNCHKSGAEYESNMPAANASGLKSLAVKHQQLIGWIEDLNESFKDLLLLEYSISSLLLAAVIIQIFSGKDVGFNIVYFLLIFSQLLALAWNANEIKEQSTELSNALYSSKWYDQVQHVKVLVAIMMMRSQKPLTLSIGPFGPMTADAALSRLKLTYSYVSLMSGNLYD